ncbi:hypothetical protein E2C01_037300 [Portunus trituberculatus]|uniref:Uncharacterized protein n=1 Tax=Portunus trituberculatus TaxID=210409 RepID=A0A5B7FDM2_PORTR|nr:hypothetical protein [Portunus trituberculatus]
MNVSEYSKEAFSEGTHYKGDASFKETLTSRRDIRVFHVYSVRRQLFVSDFQRNKEKKSTYRQAPNQTPDRSSTHPPLPKATSQASPTPFFPPSLPLPSLPPSRTTGNPANPSSPQLTPTSGYCPLPVSWSFPVDSANRQGVT